MLFKKVVFLASNISNTWTMLKTHEHTHRDNCDSIINHQTTMMTTLLFSLFISFNNNDFWNSFFSLLLLLLLKNRYHDLPWTSFIFFVVSISCLYLLFWHSIHYVMMMMFVNIFRIDKQTWKAKCVRVHNVRAIC